MNTAKPSTADTAFGRFRLERYPLRSGSQLQAWNSADLLLLEQARSTKCDPATTLLVNDEHGALSCALPNATLWTDSRLSLHATRNNRRANGIEDELRYLRADEQPPASIAQVLLRIPKDLGLIRYQLCRLRTVLSAGVPVYAAGMDKHLAPGTADLLEDYMGPTQRHRGQKKARMFTAATDKALRSGEPPWRSYELKERQWTLKARPGVFAGAHLDIGSRCLLEQMEKLPTASSIVDLGCGNGLLGLVAAATLPGAEVSFVDESSLAIESAKYNAKGLTPDAVDRMHWLWNDGLADFTGAAPDLVLCNPPFHHGHVVDDFNGRRLIQQAAECLSPDGELWLVANRHLPYHGELKRRFARVETLFQNSKFVVFRAVKESIS